MTATEKLANGNTRVTFEATVVGATGTLAYRWLFGDAANEAMRRFRDERIARYGKPFFRFRSADELPGDTVYYDGRLVMVPSTKDCADADYYWIRALGEGNPTDSRQLGFISEQRIIGRAFLVVFNHDAEQSLWRGWKGNRLLLLP